MAVGISFAVVTGSATASEVMAPIIILAVIFIIEGLVIVVMDARRALSAGKRPKFAGTGSIVGGVVMAVFLLTRIPTLATDNLRMLLFSALASVALFISGVWMLREGKHLEDGRPQPPHDTGTR